MDGTNGMMKERESGITKGGKMISVEGRKDLYIFANGGRACAGTFKERRAKGRETRRKERRRKGGVKEACQGRRDERKDMRRERGEKGEGKKEGKKKEGNVSKTEG
jgi:hypothetical protein